MTLQLDRSTWKRVTFGDVAAASREKVDPKAGEVKRYIAGEHMDTNDLSIRRWGEVGDDYLGPAFYRRFQPSQVLYGSRRTYLRKVAVAEFAGVTSNTTFVVETKNHDSLLQEFLPFVMTSESFHAFAIRESKGSVNPYVNWSDIARYEFDLPPLDEQKRLSDLLWSVEYQRRSLTGVDSALSGVRSAWLQSLFSEAAVKSGFVALDSLIERHRPICYGVLKPGPEFAGGRLIVDVKDYPSGTVKVNGVRRSDPQIEMQFKRSRLRNGDVLLSIRGTIGRVAIVPPELDGHNISRDSARLSGDRAKVLPQFLQLILESPNVQDEIRRTTTGLAVKGINVARIRSLRVPGWDLDRQQDAVQQLQVIQNSIAAVKASSAALAEVRRSLLGEIFGEAQ